MKLPENINFNIILEVEDNIKNLDENLFLYISHKNSYLCQYLLLNSPISEDHFIMNKWYLVYRNKGNDIIPVTTNEIISDKYIIHSENQKNQVQIAASFFVELITTTKEKWNDFLFFASLGLKLCRLNGYPDKIFWNDFCEAVCEKLPKQIVLLDHLGDESSLNFK